MCILPKDNVTAYTILPHVSDELKKHMDEKKIIDLQKVPDNFSLERKGYANNVYQIIKNAHKNNKAWINPDLKNLFKKFTFPFYFMDFETTMQGVPLIKGTKPYEAVPFQWSVHRWESIDIEIDKDLTPLSWKDKLM